MSLNKSKQRVADNGEVFTSPWPVDAMLDLVKDETDRIDSRFLEPAGGNGNSLARILQRKLSAVETKYGKSEFEKQHYALLAVMCNYGVELLEDNIPECRANLLESFADYLMLDEAYELYRASSYVLSQNLVHGDDLKMRTFADQPIPFGQWRYLGKGKFKRRDFLLELLTQWAAWSEEGMLWANLDEKKIFSPATTYPPVTLRDQAARTEEATYDHLSGLHPARQEPRFAYLHRQPQQPGWDRQEMNYG